MAQELLADARRKNTEIVMQRQAWKPMRVTCPSNVSKLIMQCLDFRNRTRFERVSREWREFARDVNAAESRPVWMYVIFRKGRLSGHDRLIVSVSTDGPIFWSKLVIYVYCCSCHYNGKHEVPLMGILNRVASRINRICLVDSPIDYAFLPDSFFWYITNHCTSLQFLYLREIDLEHLNYNTVKKLRIHPSLKKLIVHQCRKFDVLTDFDRLPQLLVVTGEIQGLKALLGDYDYGLACSPNQSRRSLATSGKQTPTKSKMEDLSISSDRSGRDEEDTLSSAGTTTSESGTTADESEGGSNMDLVNGVNGH